MTRRKYSYICLLFLSVLVLPATLFARKRNAAPVVLQPVLSLDQQHYFDSLYFQAITLDQCDLTDSAIHVMTQATEFYDSLLTASGYIVLVKFPTEEPKVVPKGLATPAPSQVPGLAAAYSWLCNRYRHQNNALASILSISHAVAIDSVNYWYTESEGSLYLALKRLEDARVCYERLVRLYPDKSDPLYNMSAIYLNLDSIDLCLQTLNRLEELDGISPQLTEYKFGILQDNGRLEEGFEEYRKLIARYPYNVEYRIHLGDLQMQNGQIGQAKQTYDAAAAIEPDNAYVWVAQANYFSMTGNQEAADHLVASALTNANLDVETKAQVMEEYLKGSYNKLSQYRVQSAQGNTSVALDTMALFHNVDSLFTEVVAMHPTADHFYSLQAQWRDAMNQDSLASECMRFAVDLKPTSRDYWEHLLIYSVKWMPKPQLISLCQEMRELHTDSQLSYDVASWAYINMDDIPSAIQQYQLAIEHMSPPDANRVSTLWGNIGDLYYRMDSLDLCWDCYEKAVKYNPTNYSVLNNYAYYLSEARRDLSRAEQMSLKTIQKYPDNPTYLDTYAWILYLEGSYTLAIFYQQHAIDCIEEDDDGNSTLFEHYGDMLVKTNDLTGAAEQWRKALQCSDCENAEVIQKKIDSAELLSR